MQLSASLADFMSKLDNGPSGIDDAITAVEECAANCSSKLDLQQMFLTDEDFDCLSSRLESVADHVTNLNLFMNE